MGEEDLDIVYQPEPGEDLWNAACRGHRYQGLTRTHAGVRVARVVGREEGALTERNRIAQAIRENAQSSLPLPLDRLADAIEAGTL